MNNLGEYFYTDWVAMTLHDWIGMILSVSLFLLMVWAYVYAFSPKNKERFEAQRHIPLDEGKFDGEKL